MNKISEAFIGYNFTEEEKYVEILKDLISKKEIPDFPKFTKETEAKKKNRAKKVCFFLFYFLLTLLLNCVQEQNEKFQNV